MSSKKKRIFCPKTTQFGPKLAFLFILGQALPAHLVGGCGARAASLKTPIYFILILVFARSLNEIFFNLLGKWRENTRDRRPCGAGNPPHREGGFPAPPRIVGKGGFPALPRKNDQNRGEVEGQNKGLNLNFLQKRKQMMEQYYNTEQCPIQPVNRICKRK